MATKTFLDLCQQLVEDAGITGNFTSVVSQTGEFKRVVNWVARSVTEIEGLWFNWDFLNVFHSFDTVVGVRDYPAPANYNLWDYATARLPDREQRLDFIQWTRQKLDPTKPFNGDPYRYTILPDKAIRLYDTPVSILTVEIEYWRKPTVLTANLDEPSIPEQFRDIVVYKALWYYANYESADEAKIQATENYGARLRQLESYALPANQASGSINTGTDIVVQVPFDQGLDYRFDY